MMVGAMVDFEKTDAFPIESIAWLQSYSFKRNRDQQIENDRPLCHHRIWMDAKPQST
jgi:hypothetical protein